MVGVGIFYAHKNGKKEKKEKVMKNLVLLATMIFLAASTTAYSSETSVKDCAAFAESNERVGKDVKASEQKKQSSSKAKSN